MGSTLTVASREAFPVSQSFYTILTTQPSEPREYSTTGLPPRIAATDPNYIACFAGFEDWLKFQRLLAQWRDERGVMSSISEAALCPAYQGIIGMGKIALPFILRQLASEGDEPDQWFWALQAITETNPVSADDRGNYERMSRAWIQWAVVNQYAW